MGKKDKRFEEIWQLEMKIFDRFERSNKKDLKDIYDCRELLIINDYGYAIGSALEETEKKELPKEELKNFGKNNTTYVWSIGILPEHRGKGHGKEMLKGLINLSTKSRITLDTTNNDMKKMCHKLGFKQISETYFVYEKQPSILTNSN